jgi:hypothetical protein
MAFAVAAATGRVTLDEARVGFQGFYIVTAPTGRVSHAVWRGEAHTICGLDADMFWVDSAAIVDGSRPSCLRCRRAVDVALPVPQP